MQLESSLYFSLHFSSMRRFQVGDAVRVLISWSAVSDQVGTVLDFVDRSQVDGEHLYLVKFPDRFMRFHKN
jgi:hypothetical protein